jgi:transposase-like protein
VSMTGNADRVEVITSVQRRRRWSAEEKARIVQETYAPGMSVSLVARQHGIARNQVFTWRRLYAGVHCRRLGPARRLCPPPNTGPRSTRCASCSGCWARRPWRTRFCATRSNWHSQKNKKTAVAVAVAGTGRYAVKKVADTLGVARPNLAVQAAPERTPQRRGRHPPPDTELLAEIKALIAGQPTYG